MGNSFCQTMEKFCLKWNDFEPNIRDYFKKLRGDQKLFDVTLATEDGQETNAHKIVLSAGSDFFSDIFIRNNHPNMYIFLKGVGRSQLEQVIDFLYYGEVSITQDEMKDFFETAKSLQIKGLQGDIQGMGENIQEELKPELVDTNKEYEEAYHSGQNNITNEETIVDSFDSLDDSVNEIAGMYTDKELDQQIAEMIEKTAEGKWKCRVCGKKLSNKQHTMRHAETHIEGSSYTCPMCSKTCSTRQYLRAHISGSHTGFFTCTLCNKTGMNRHAYHVHNNRYHKNK